METESIYNLIPKHTPDPPKKKMYKSKYDPKAPLTGSTFSLNDTTTLIGKGIKNTKTTFPPKENHPPNPSNFLRKKLRTQSSSLSKQQQQKQQKKKLLEPQKPAVPTRDDRPIMGLQTTKNFITANAVDLILSHPPPPKQQQQRQSSPQKVVRHDFGKVPKYLQRIQNEIAQENEIIERYVQDQYRRSSSDEYEENHEVMNEDERNELINHLKAKWDRVNTQYQKHCHRVALDTVGDVKRKEMHERELKQLEDDIDRLSRPGPLMIQKG